MISRRMPPAVCSACIESSASEQRRSDINQSNWPRRPFGMIKKSLIIPLVVLLAAAGLLFGYRRTFDGLSRKPP